MSGGDERVPLEARLAELSDREKAERSSVQEALDHIVEELREIRTILEERKADG